MRVNASTFEKAKRSGIATAIRVQPTGTAVTDYQISVGNRQSIREIGAVGAHTWCEKATLNESWVKVPRIAAGCPRIIVVFDGGDGDIDKCMVFGDEFNGTSLNTTKWNVISGVPQVANGIATLTSDASIEIKTVFGAGYEFLGNINIFPPVGSGNYATYGFGHAVGYYDSNNSFLGYIRYSCYDGSTYRYANLFITSGYHNVGIRFFGALNSKLYVDRVHIASHTTGVLAGTYAPNISGSGAGWVLANWIVMRKCAANEPIAGTAKPTATNRAMSRSMSQGDLIRACCL